MEYGVIIPAAGSGKRMGAPYNKLFITLNGKTIIEWTVEVFANDPNCHLIVLPTNPDDRFRFEELFHFSPKVAFVDGGSERQYSVHNGLEVMSESVEIIVVHDGARPFIKVEQITEIVKNANEHGASVLAVPVKDTVKKVANHFVTRTIPRESLWAIQTPQAFQADILRQAHMWAETMGYLGTDEASLVERIGEEVYITEGSYDNIKITTQEDLVFAEAILKKRGEKNV